MAISTRKEEKKKESNVGREEVYTFLKVFMMTMTAMMTMMMYILRH